MTVISEPVGFIYWSISTSTEHRILDDAARNCGRQVLSRILGSLATRHYQVYIAIGPDPFCHLCGDRPTNRATVCYICRSRELQFVCNVLGAQ